MDTPSNDAPVFNAVAFRKNLHRFPELSLEEVNTSQTIARVLSSFGLKPVTEIGGHGLFCIIEGEDEGETTLIRADFDALPIEEQAQHDHVSANHGVMHACGHDGHTTSLLKIAQQLAEHPPKSGQVVLLFQPAEEIGTGAASMLTHPALRDLTVDNAYAYHNLPGYPLHQIVVKTDTFACASTGVSITLTGKTSHAARPENGISPTNTMMDIMQLLQGMPQRFPDAFSLVTIVHAQLGEAAYGVSPGEAKVMATMRSECNETFQAMQTLLTEALQEFRAQSGLDIHVEWDEPFNATVNSAQHVSMLVEQANQLGLSVHQLDEPMRWSEDFAEFLLKWRGAMFCIGSGTHHPELHNPDYDFPDDIMDTAASLFVALIRRQHGLTQDL
ncbi:amidohydrolase [Vibrio proteolyticus]|uniref:Peptidase M20 family protein n=1 Tax=Vibrio proteolyticus NBRC 13287 TaxID=1219065 RepID=U3A0E2_VIBPR|nr:amidohydrolase [Vibrio proteolyticus]GAD66797.1 peptidase M20 family protein [Vibrio proteolyticus NBRC 13287]